MKQPQLRGDVVDEVIGGNIQRLEQCEAGESDWNFPIELVLPQEQRCQIGQQAEGGGNGPNEVIVSKVNLLKIFVLAAPLVKQCATKVIHGQEDVGE